MKSFSTVRDTQRGTQSYMEKRRRRREIEVIRRRGGIKRGESKLASNHFPMCSPVWIPQRCSWSYTEKTRGRKETEVARGIKGGIKRRGTDPASNQFLSVLHSPEHTKRFTELGREEKREGGDRSDLVEKKESQKWGECSQASDLAPK